MTIAAPATERRGRNHTSEWPHRVTEKDAAGFFGVTRQALGHWRRAGCPVNGDGTYDLRAAHRWKLAKEIEDRAPGDRNEEETRRIAALADTYEFKLAVMRGEYIKADLVASLWADRVTAARVSMMALPAALGPAIIGLDADGVRRLMTDRIRSVLEDLAREFETALQGMADDEESDDR